MQASPGGAEWMEGAPSAASGIGDGGVTARTQGWLPVTSSFYAWRKNREGKSEREVSRTGTVRGRPSGVHPGFRYISTSMVISTSSPTTTPPVSSAAFHTSPKSFRLIFVLAWPPTR